MILQRILDREVAEISATQAIRDAQNATTWPPSCRAISTPSPTPQRPTSGLYAVVSVGTSPIRARCGRCDRPR